MKSSIAKILSLTFTCAMASACYEDNSFLKKNTQEALLQSDLTQGQIGPVPPYVWTSLAAPDLYPVDQQEHYANTVVTLNDEVYSMFGWGDHEVIHKLNQSRMRWERVTGMSRSFKPGGHLAFSRGSKLYFLSKYEVDGQENFFGCVNPFTGVRTTLSPFPGTVCREYTFFVIGSKGYVAGGLYGSSNTYSDQLWEYDIVSDHWADKGRLPGGARSGGSAFVIGNYVYLGFGIDSPYGSGTHYRKDWVKFSPGSQFYVTLPDFPVTGRLSGRYEARGFVLKDKIYVGWGNSGDLSANDFWEYDPGDDEWTRKADCPATTGLSNVNAFSIGNAGYVVVGNLKRFSRYANTSLILTSN